MILCAFCTQSWASPHSAGRWGGAHAALQAAETLGMPPAYSQHIRAPRLPCVLPGCTALAWVGCAAHVGCSTSMPVHSGFSCV